jgi:hypothetical protein
MYMYKQRNGQLTVSDLIGWVMPVIWLVNNNIIVHLWWHHHHPIGGRGGLVTLLDSTVATGMETQHTCIHMYISNHENTLMRYTHTHTHTHQGVMLTHLFPDLAGKGQRVLWWSQSGGWWCHVIDLITANSKTQTATDQQQDLGTPDLKIASCTHTHPTARVYKEGILYTLAYRASALGEVN